MASVFISIEADVFKEFPDEGKLNGARIGRILTYNNSIDQLIPDKFLPYLSILPESGSLYLRQPDLPVSSF